MKTALYWLLELSLITVMVLVVGSNPAPMSSWFRTVSADDQLLSSSWAGDDEQFDDALRRGASVAACDASGSTPLHYAAASGDACLARRLIALGADVNAANRSGATPLVRAATNDHADLVGILLREGAEPSDDVLEAAVFAKAERAERVLRGWRETMTEDAGP